MVSVPAHFLGTCYYSISITGMRHVGSKIPNNWRSPTRHVHFYIQKFTVKKKKALLQEDPYDFTK